VGTTPIRLIIAALVTLCLAGLPAGGAGAQADPIGTCGRAFPAYGRAPLAVGATRTDVEIPMSDGVVLRADVTLPAGPGPFPTALTITGYGKSSGAAAFGGGSGGMASYGYAAVVVDDRGTGASGGRWDSWGERTVDDYPEVLDWIVDQPWSDGRVGLTGASYMAITSLFAAASQHPAVEAVFATVPMADGYRDIVFGGGQVNTAFIPLWAGLVTGLSLMPSADPSTIPEHLLAVPDFQLPTIADAVVGGGTVYDGPFWRQRSPIEVVDRIDVPTFIVGGLDDLFQRGEPMLYEALADHTDARLLIGPWTHIAAGQGLPTQGVPTIDELLLQWFDQHVMGLDTGADCIPPVTLYKRGVDRYESAPTWPVPDLHAERWHLRGGQRLTQAAPGDEAPSTYLQVPANGVCSRSTAQWLIGLIDSTPCATDNRLDEATALTWTSEPFSAPVEINGPIQADLWLRPLLSQEAVVSVAISDVAPDGTSRGLTNGLLLASHRAVDPLRSRTLDGQSIQPWHPFTAAAQQTVTPGEPALLPVEVFPTSAVLQPGHRLRVTIAAYDVPHALPTAPAALATLAGPVEVLNDSAHPSSVVLPVVGARSQVSEGPGSGPAPTTAPTGTGGQTLPATGGTAPGVLAAALLAVALLTGLRARSSRAA
jgi:putative CocE/NonD family hydrolase